MNSFGYKLKAERERQGYDLDAVSDATKIRKLYLSALEEDDFAQLPARVYATGFVATYARFLKMDAEALVQEFKTQVYPEEARPRPVEAPQKIVRRRRKIRSGKQIRAWNIIAAGLFLLIVWWLGSYIAAYIGEQGVDKQTAPQPAPMVQVPEAVTAVIPEAEPAAPAADKTAAGLLLVIDARQQCWLAVSVDGAKQFEGMIAAGEQQTYHGRESIVIRAGNSGGIDLSLNGQKLAPLGEVGQVVEKKFDLASISKE